MVERRISCVVEDATKAELESLAGKWDVSVASLIREAVLAFLQEPHKPAVGLRRPTGRPRTADDTLASALYLLRRAGAQPSQIARACVGDIGKDALRRVRLKLPHVGRFKDCEIQLDAILIDAAAILVSHGRNVTVEMPSDAPLLVRGTEDLRPWPAARIARAMKRGKQLATMEEPTDDQNDRSAGVGRA